MMSKFKLTSVFLVLLLAALAACGGGGGGAAPGPAAAVITAQPTDQSVVEGTTATFDVATTDATGYQWQSSTDGGGTFADILSATTASYTTMATILADSGTQYRVVVSGAGNTVTSNAALLFVSAAPAPPAFTTQPVDVTITEGHNAQFTVVVSGVPTPTLQWQVSTDGGVTWNSINGATGTTLDLAGVALGNTGRQFRAVATNGSGSIDSNAAVLTVLPKAWGTGALIETDNTGDAIGPRIAIDANGNAMAAWVQDGDATAGQRFDVWARRCTAGVWGTAELIETNTGSADGLQLAINANGNAIALWSQATGTSFSIWANSYTAGAGWGTAMMIGIDSAFSFAPQIAIDANGNALAVWIRIDTTSHIWANRYTAGVGWGTAAAIETNTADSADSPQIAMDGSGNAMAVWAQSSALVGSIWANRYTAGAGWGTAALIETGADNAYGPQIAVDAGGNALAVWSQSNGTVYNVWSNRYSAGVWGTAALIESDDAGSVNGPQIAVDANGNALAVWSQSNGTVNNIWANRYTAGADWGSAELIETNNGSFADNPRIAFDAVGNAMAVWNQYRPITYNRYTAGIGWSTAALVDPNNSNQPTSPPQIAIDVNGDAWAVWSQHDSTRYNIMANRYQ